MRTPADWPIISVIIPAHNEAQGIARTLAALQNGAQPGELEVIVVCNGCSDDTAERARLTRGVTVLELVEPSKYQAIQAGNVVATAPVRVLLDADVSITANDLRRLKAALVGDIVAVAPRRRMAASGSRLIDSYYRVWEGLPQVRTGLFGRGVIALAEPAWRRAMALPSMMSDDLVVSEAFGAGERRIVEEAVVEIQPPRRWADLLRRRVRVVTGNVQADQQHLRGATSQTSAQTLFRICREHPRLIPDVFVFIGVTVVARLAARPAISQGDFQTWLRDDSSRGSL